MNGRIFAQALCSLHGKELRTLYVLCCDTGTVDIISGTVRDWLPGDSNHFMQKLDEKVAALSHQSDAKLQLDILLELAKRLEIRGSHLITDVEIEDFAAEIIVRADQQMSKQDPRYRAHKEKNASMDPLQTMIRFQLNQLLSQVGKELDSSSSTKQQEYLEKVQEFIRAMPDEKQAQIKQRLGVNQLTNEVLQNIVITSGASVLFAVIVEVSGFAFYTTATSLLASLAGLLGVTLSFGTYTALTSVVAVLANPLFILLLLGGGGLFLYRSQNSKLQSKMLPILILQITLPALSGAQESISYHLLQEIWKTSWDQHQEIKALIFEQQHQSEKSVKEIAACSEEIQSAKQKIDQNEKQITKTIEELRQCLTHTDLSRLQVSGRFAFLSTQYAELDLDIMRKRKDRQNQEEGFFNWVSQQLQAISNQTDIVEMQRKQAELLEKLATEIMGGAGDRGRAERELVQSLKQENRALRQEITALERRRSEHETKREDCLMNLAKLKKVISSLEQQVYGLQHI